MNIKLKVTPEESATIQALHSRLYGYITSSESQLQHTYMYIRNGAIGYGSITKFFIEDINAEYTASDYIKILEAKVATLLESFPKLPIHIKVKPTDFGKLKDLVEFLKPVRKIKPIALFTDIQYFMSEVQVYSVTDARPLLINLGRDHQGWISHQDKHQYRDIEEFTKIIKEAKGKLMETEELTKIHEINNRDKSNSTGKVYIDELNKILGINNMATEELTKIQELNNIEDIQEIPDSQSIGLVIDSFSKFKQDQRDKGSGNSPTPLVWANPKPNLTNIKDINIGTYCLVNGKPLVGRVTKLELSGDAFVTFLGIPEIVYDTIVSLEDIHPVYRLKSGTKAKIGDVVKNVSNSEDLAEALGIATLYDSYELITNKSDLAFVNTLDTKTYVLLRRTPTEANCVESLDVFEFSCGTIVDKFTNIPLKGNTPIALIREKVQHSHEYHQMAKHYQVSVAELIPKDDIIYEQLCETLDHFINVADKEWAMLVGPSGSGKTVMAIKYAEEHGLAYVKWAGSGQVTSDDLLGYKSITTGEYFSTLLRDAVETGKVFILDEIDACNPNTLLVLNGLKDDYYQFPDTLVEVHKDFRLIGTANTLGYSEEYNSRHPMDKATLARFDVIRYDMEDHELALRYGFKWVKDINTSKLTPREVQRLVNKLKIAESKAVTALDIENKTKDEL